MPEEDPHSIYHRESRPDADPDLTTSPNADPGGLWKEAIRESRWRLFRFWFVLLAFTGLIIVLMRQQVKLSKVEPQAQISLNTSLPGDAPAPEEQKVILPTLLESMPVFPRVDALYDLQVRSSGSTNQVLRSDAVKEAAVAIVRAEDRFQQREWAEARGHYERALTLVPSMQGIHRYLAVCHLQERNHPAALQSFEQALQEDPEDPGIYNNLGATYMALGEYDKAEKVLRECTRIRPRYAMAWYHLGSIYTERKDYPAAVKHLETMLELKPEHFKSLQLYANALLQSGDYQTASVVLKDMISQMPSAAAPYFHLAHAHAELDQPSEAVTQLRSGIRLLDLKKARERLDAESFDSLREHPEFKTLIISLDARLLNRP